MKLYSKNTGKFTLLFGVGLMLTVLCSFLLFGGVINTGRLAFAEEETEQSTTPQIVTSLTGFTPTKDLEQTENGVYQISTVGDLRALAYYINKSESYSTYATAKYQLTTDLDLSGFTFWEAIGTADKPFMGEFDGGGYSIYGLTIIEDTTATTDDVQTTYRGLFGYVKYNGTSDVKIHNLGLRDTLIKSKGTYTGGLVAFAEGLTEVGVGKVNINECYNMGYVEGGKYVGGLIGAMVECATLTYSYFAGSVRDLYVGDALVNSTYDVVTNVDGGSVGGLAGFAVDDSVHRVIEYCYNAGIVGMASGITLEQINRGALVGFRDDLKRSLLKYNFFLSTVLPDAKNTEKNAQGGTYAPLRNVSSSTWTGLFGNDNVGVPTGNNDLPTGDDAEKPWQYSSKVNNGLPFLKNTQQLVKIKFETHEISVNGTTTTDSGEIASKDFSNSISKSDYRLKVDDNTYLVRILDKLTLNVSSQVASKSDADYSYKFYNWEQSALTTSVGGTSAKSISVPTTAATAIYCEVDKVFKANYVEREYSVVLTPNDASYVSQLTLNQETSSTANLTLSGVKFGEKITVSATPIAGYVISNFTTTSASGDFLNKVNGNWTLDTKAYIKAIGNNASDTDTVENTPLSVTVNCQPETYSYYFLSNREDCKSAGYVLNDKKVILRNGDSLAYNQKVYLVVDPSQIVAGYTFAGWQYQAVNLGNEPKSDAWTSIDSQRYDSIDFVIPDLENNQTICFKANFEKIRYSVEFDSYNEGQIAILSDETTTTSDRAFTNSDVFYVKITANDGYKFDAVKLNGTSYTIGESTQLNGTASVSWESNLLKVTNLSSKLNIAVEFKKCEYTVGVSVNSSNVVSTLTKVVDANNVSVLGDANKVLFNDNFTFKVELEGGYKIDSVCAGNLVLVATENNEYTATITGDTVITVNIHKEQFTVSVKFDYAENNYQFSLDESCIHGAQTYYYGVPYNVYIDLPDMFKVNSWKIDGQEYSYTTSASRDSITNNVDIVIYLELKTSTISFGQIGDSTSNQWYTIVSNGVKSDYQPNMSNKEVKYGDTVQFKVDDQYFDKSGRSKMYSFAYWQVNGKSVSTAKAFALTVDAPTYLVEAVYKPSQIVISTNSYLFDNLSGKQSLSSEAGSVSGTYYTTYGKTITLKAYANDGYEFVRWEDSKGNTLLGSGAKGDEYTFQANEDTKINAVFIMVRSVYVIAEAEQGKVSGANVYKVGDTVNLTATATKGYKFVSWNIDGVSKSKNAEYSFTMPANDVKFTAEFERVYSINFYTSDNSLGQIVGNTSGSFKENITLEAISANNCSFVGWMVNNVMVSNKDKLNISLNGDITVQALFKKNFNWNIIIVILGSAIFALVMVYGAIAYIKSKEAQPISTRALIGSKDDSDIIRKASKRNALRDEIAPVPTRKIQRVNVQPVPVRKIAVEPTDHKGNKVKPTEKAKNKKATLKTEE